MTQKNTFSTYLTSFARASSKTSRGRVITNLRGLKPINASSANGAYAAMRNRLERLMEPETIKDLEPVIRQVANQFGEWRQSA